MSAKPKSRASEALLPSNEFQPPSPDESVTEYTVVDETPTPVPCSTAPAPADDPLHAILVLSEEEKIALCG